MLKKFALTLIIAAISQNAFAAPQTTVTGKLLGGSGYSVLLLQKDGSVQTAKVASNGAFTMKAASIKNATLQLLSPSGRYAGPILLRRILKSKKGYDVLSGQVSKSGSSPKLTLGTIKLGSGFGFLKADADKSFVTTSAINLKPDGSPTGAGTLGLSKQTTNTQARSSKVRAGSRSGSGSDSDGDGVPNAMDADDDNDGVLDTSDSNTPASETAILPFTTLYLDEGRTLNSHISAVTSSQIDQVIGGNGTFNLILFLNRPASTDTGAHVVCSSALSYCAPSTGTAVYTGVSESNPALLNQPWASYDADRSGYPNLEPLSRGGRDSFFIAGIQPRVGTSDFRPGDTLIVEFTRGATVTSRKTMTLPPYFVTVPALKSYTVGSTTTDIDYTVTSPPGSSSNPIVATGGVVTFSFWRPQIVVPTATGTSFIDNGHLNYGVILGGPGINGEFSCARLYSNLSSTLSEVTTTGVSPDDGTPLWPLVDSADDGSSEAGNFITLTVDLGACLARTGAARGDYSMTLTAAGRELTGGSNRAGQNINVRIP